MSTGAPGAGDALLVVDVQRDFLPGGALGVAGGDRVIEPLNRWIARFSELGLPVLATRDWHPPNRSVRKAGPGRCTAWLKVRVPDFPRLCVCPNQRRSCPRP
jgi:nicotinamidase-related amidase